MNIDEKLQNEYKKNMQYHANVNFEFEHSDSQRHYNKIINKEMRLLLSINLKSNTQLKKIVDLSNDSNWIID